MKKLLFAFAFFLPAALWAQTTDEAVAYNDKIVNAQNDIGEMFLTFNESMSTDDASYANSELIRLEILKVIDESIATVKSMGPFDKSSELKNAAVSLFGFYKSVVSTEYKEMLEIVYKEELTEEDQNRIQVLLEKITVEEAPFDQVFQDAQIRFAEKYNIELQENELQEELDGE